jgi:hypothetical protein
LASNPRAVLGTSTGSVLLSSRIQKVSWERPALLFMFTSSNRLLSE